jgi:hypothetical protein
VTPAPVFGPEPGALAFFRIRQKYPRQ